MTEEVKKKFVPKRRAPYLLQDEVISKNNVAANQDYHKKNTKVTRKNQHSSPPMLLPHQKPNEINGFDVISRLYGIQKKIIIFFVKSCMKRQSNQTGAVTLETLCDITGTTKKTLKKTIQRLIEKNIIKRVGGKRGKGGFSIFSLEQDIINVAKIKLDMEQEINLNSNRIDSANYESANKLPEEWGSINFSRIEGIGFGVSHIKQLYNSKITTPEIVVKSIEHFAFALENNPSKFKKYKSELSALMSTLTRGGVWLEPNYESPVDKALRLKLDYEKKERQQRLQREGELIHLEFDKWYSELTKDDVEKLIPERVKTAKYAKDSQTISFLKEYFKDKYWGTIKKEKYEDCFN